MKKRERERNPERKWLKAEGQVEGTDSRVDVCDRMRVGDRVCAILCVCGTRVIVFVTGQRTE